MSQRTLTGILASAVTVIVVAIALAKSDNRGNVIHVPKDYQTIQEAIDAAKDGDEIIVAPRTYNEAIDLLGKSIELRSSDGPEKTIIDAAGLDASVVTIANGESADTLIEGFTITGGRGTPVELDGSEIATHGGGMYIQRSSPTIAGCIIADNAAMRGAGLYLGASAAHLSDCVISNNESTGTSEVLWWVFRGGGVHIDGGSEAVFSNCLIKDNVSFFQFDEWTSASGVGGGVSIVASSPTFEDCVIEGNNAAHGGGMSITTGSHPQLTGCHFKSNWAYYIDTGHSWGRGGGVAVSSSNPTFTDCVFEANWSESGGAMSLVSSSPVVVNCQFIGNEAVGFDWGQGGAVYNGSNSSPEFTNCHFSNNRTLNGDPILATGGAIANNGMSGPSHATVTKCTFEGNEALSGGAISVGWWQQSSIVITESVFLANSATFVGGAIYIEIIPPANLVIENTNFCNNSPQHIWEDWTDMGGNLFPPPADLNCDGVVDDADLLILLAAWGGCPDPDDCPADLDGDGVVDGGDLLILLSNWG